MLIGGLVSISFRELGIEDIIDLVKKSGLSAIEWGGDVHVPHGNLKKAREVCKKTKKAGLEIASYGSYYKVGCEKGNIDCSFAKVLDTAVALDAPLIRVWAGDKGSDAANEEWWNQVVEKSNEIAAKADKENIKIAYEYHGGTLTDTNESTLRLLKEVNHPNLYTYWQPPHQMSVEKRQQDLKNVLPWLSNIHVFHWESHDRFPLKKGAEDWNKYFEIVAKTENKHYAMLEFVKDDKPQQFLDDAKTLFSLIK